MLAVPKLFGTRDQFCRRQFFHGRRGRGWFPGMSQAYYIYYALYFYYYYIMMYNEIIIQLTIMQNQWDFTMVSVQSNLSANNHLYLQPFFSTG